MAPPQFGVPNGVAIVSPLICFNSVSCLNLQYAALLVDQKKANQDKQSISRNFAGIKGDSLFAIYDGHGRYGHDCAQFAKGNYPKILAKHIRRERVRQHKINMEENGTKGQKGSFNPKLWPMLNKDRYTAAVKKAHFECNRAMHKDDNVSS